MGEDMFLALGAENISFLAVFPRLYLCSLYKTLLTTMSSKHEITYYKLQKNKYMKIDKLMKKDCSKKM